MTFEIRTADLWPDADYELRAKADGFEFEGYAAVFNMPSVPMQFAGLGGGRRFREVISPGAFTDSLSGNPDVTLRYQHNMTMLPLARTSVGGPSTPGGMTLTQDDRGLRVQALLLDNAWSRPYRDAVHAGLIRGMSFRFSNAQDSWSQDGKYRLRTLRRVDLGPEVSITDYPAYPDTMAMVRAVAEALEANFDEGLAELSEALKETKLAPDQRDRLISVINTHSDVPVLDKSHVDKLAQMRERLEKLSAA